MNNNEPVTELSVADYIDGLRRKIPDFKELSFPTISAFGANAAMMHASTTYYVTFEVESGDRMEMNVGGQDYGMLTEGDVGKLTFQGTRYLNFERY